MLSPQPTACNSASTITLIEAVEFALRQNQIVRISDGEEVAASRSTFYDIDIAKTQVDAALAAYDASLNARMFGNDITKPPNAFFGPGITAPLQRDEAAVPDRASLIVLDRDDGVFNTVTAAARQRPNEIAVTSNAFVNGGTITASHSI